MFDTVRNGAHEHSIAVSDDTTLASSSLTEPVDQDTEYEVLR